jgi:hypothetical protein
MLQGLMNPCYSDFVRSCQFDLGPQWKALVSTKNLTLSILLEYQAAFYWEDLVTVTEGQLESTSKFLAFTIPQGGLTKRICWMPNPKYISKWCSGLSLCNQPSGTQQFRMQHNAAASISPTTVLNS